MKKKIRIFSNIAIICLSVCMFAFGVYAANQVSVTTSGTVTFTAQNVEATISRKLFGFDAVKSEVTTTEEKDTGVFEKTINKTTVPEGATYEIPDLKDEHIYFKDGHKDIVMEFKITNDSDDKDLFVKLIDNETRESTNVRKIAESLGGEILVEPGETRQFCIYLDVIDSNVSGSAYYDYTIQLNNTTDAIEIDETMVTLEDIKVNDWTTNVNCITGWAEGFDPSKLTNIIIPNTLGGEYNYIIPSSAFNNLPNLKNVMFRRSIDHVYNAFNNCTGLEYMCLNISMDVKNSFTNCTNLKSLYIGASVTPFVGCPNIQAITFGEYASTEDGKFFGDDENYNNTNRKVNNLKSIDSWKYAFWTYSMNATPLYGGADLFLNGEEVVDFTFTGDYQFSYCNSLKTAIISEDVRSISTPMFANCKNLTTITIENANISSIMDSTFYCPSLKQINFAGTKEQWKSISGIEDPMAFNNPSDSGKRDTIEQVTVSCSDGNVKYVYVDEMAKYVWQDVA